MGESGWIAILVAVIAALPGVLTTLYAKRRTSAEATDTLINAALKIVQSLKDEIEHLKQTNQELRDKIDQLEQELARLKSENKELMVNKRPVTRKRSQSS